MSFSAYSVFFAVERTSAMMPRRILEIVSPFWNSRVMPRSSMTGSPCSHISKRDSFLEMACATSMLMISMTSASSSVKRPPPALLTTCTTP